ncbi:hypothetical protein [Aliarcobacter butzleri]|uniref:hypothetical protein n=1 Tax=Aliarcobacter butzleri TaxID=28197 RepID=UPI0021B38E89|nr:hypothetical protein [Aliarcobacter butzleri]MCT7568489.1 hypothetical protein [Aliarcobacter butzleri]
MLQDGDTGSYEELSKEENPNDLMLLYIPGLEALFERALQLKGTDLSNEEKEKIKQRATVIATHPEAAKQVIEKRGYI